MKLIILLFAITYSACADPCDKTMEKWVKLLAPFQNQCIEETNVSKEYAKNWLVKQEYFDDPILQCYLTCLHRHLGIMLSDNSIDTNTLSQIAEGVNKDMAEFCNHKVKLVDNPCKKSMEISKCALDP